MKKVKILTDTFSASLLKEFFARINQTEEVVRELEVEHLVLLEWHRKNYLKVQFDKAPYKVSMLLHEAISLRRMLFRIGLSNPMTAIYRDQLCDQILQQLPPNQSRTQLN